LNSIKSTYLHEARVLKAFMRDPAELGGLRESDAERDSSTSDDYDRAGESETESDICYARDQGGLAGADVVKGKGVDGAERPILAGPAIITGDNTTKSSSSRDRPVSHSPPRSSTSTSRKPPSRRSQKSSIDSTRSRRVQEKTNSPTSPHPFAYQQPVDIQDREDDALLALEDAAREIARQRAKLTPMSSPGKARFDDAEEEPISSFKFPVGRGLPQHQH